MKEITKVENDIRKLTKEWDIFKTTYHKDQAAIESAILQLQQNIITILTAIGNIQSDVADHESRITALENAGP